MENAITLPLDVLRAMLVIAPKNDCRPCLNGVYIEHRAGHVRAVTTDGRCMMVWRDPEETSSVEELAAGAILPRNLVERAVKMAGKAMTHANLSISTGADGARRILTLNTAGGECMDAELEGKYPNYCQTLPRTLSGELAQFDLRFLTAFSKVGDALGCKYPIIGHNGASCAVVDFGRTDIFAIVMPLRTESVPAIPEWRNEGDVS